MHTFSFNYNLFLNTINNFRNFLCNDQNLLMIFAIVSVLSFGSIRLKILRFDLRLDLKKGFCLIKNHVLVL
jgi:hypothetical protein